MDQVKLKLEIKHNVNYILSSLFLLFCSSVTFVFTIVVYIILSKQTVTNCEDLDNCLSLNCSLNFTLYNKTKGNCQCYNKADETYTCKYEESHFNTLSLIFVFLGCLMFMVIVFLLYNIFGLICENINKNRKINGLICNV